MPEPYWACARTLSRQETATAMRLECAGFEVLAPKIELRRSVVPLFAGYIFIRVEAQSRAIASTIGILCLIRFGDTPARVPDAEIEALRRRADQHGLIRLPPAPPRRAWAKGDRVRIVAGQFASFNAIHSGMSARAREIVLVNILGGQRQAAVASHLVVAL